MSDTSSVQPERRRFHRAELGMPVTAVRPSASESDPRRVIGLHVLNLSRGGLRAVTREVLDKQEELVLFLPPLGAQMGQDTTGQVVRCVPRSDHYELGIAFRDPLPENDRAAGGAD